MREKYKETVLFSEPEPSEPAHVQGAASAPTSDPRGRSALSGAEEDVGASLAASLACWDEGR